MNRRPHIARTADEASTLLDRRKLFELAALLNGSISCTIDQRLHEGQEHAVIRLQFENNAQWAVRMPINPNGKFPGDDIELPLQIMRSTTSLQQCLYKHGILVPRVHWSCLQWTENPVGYPLVLTDWIEGQPLDWESIRHHPEAKAKVLAQLAEFMFNLSTLTESSEALKDLQALHPNGMFPLYRLNPDNSVTAQTAAEWYYKDIDRRLLRSLRGLLKDVSPLEILSLRSSIPEYIVKHTEPLDCDRPVLFHDDIHPGNIIIDSQGELRGYFFSPMSTLTLRIIDWDMVSLVPVEAAIKLPTFLSKTMCTTSGWEVTDADRDLYVQAFRNCELAKSKSKMTPLTNLLVTSFKRAYFHEAFHSLSVHRKWFEEHGRNPAQQLLQELDDFCHANSGNIRGLQDEVIGLRTVIEASRNQRSFNGVIEGKARRQKIRRGVENGCTRKIATITPNYGM